MLSFKDIKHNLKKDVSKLSPIKVSLVGDSATQFLSIAIRGLGIEFGYNIDMYEADYNQVEQQVEDISSDLHKHGAKYTIIFQSTLKLLEYYSTLNIEEQQKLADNRLNFVKNICKNISDNIIYYNYPEIDDAIFGSYANKIPFSFIYQIRKLNFELMNLAQEYKNLYICDLSSIQNKIGRNSLFDSTIYVSTDMLISLDALPYVASRTLEIISSIEGKIKKCLILDLDNTLWGGIVGDDGWENVQIGHGLGIGKAFSEFQQWIKKLKERGIILCVCSKNDEQKAKEVFEKNPEMILKLDDIAVFIANWENKVDNIRTIQSILNISFDSMVFLDDNAFERNIVRENIPQITVPEIPEDPGEYLEYLYSVNLFETASYSITDKDRTEQYQIEAKRNIEAKTFTNETDFLKSLGMISEISGLNKFNIPRVAQLSQRSNQFNLRTIRYTEDQLNKLSQREDHKIFCFSLKDKFGDNGLISVVILQHTNEKTLFIDSWFMSCRVLKRGMENFVLNTIVRYAQGEGIKKLIGEYIPTPKNGLVKDHYQNLGFSKSNEFETNSEWQLDVTKYIDRESFIKAL